MAFVNFEPVLPLDTYSSTIPANRLAFIGKSLAAVLMALSGDAVSHVLVHTSPLTMRSVWAPRYRGVQSHHRAILQHRESPTTPFLPTLTRLPGCRPVLVLFRAHVGYDEL